MKTMNKKIRWMTETAVLLALLICLQWIGSMIPNQMIKQLITGTCVNCVLAVAALYAGYGSGLTVGLISPVFAYVLGIAPNFITVLPIMVGNVCYVVLLRLIAGKSGKPFWKQPVALTVAASVKFAVLYLLVVKIICGVASKALLGKKMGDVVVLAPPMLKMLPTMFAWPQLITAISGGIIAIAIVPALRKALRK